MIAPQDIGILVVALVPLFGRIGLHAVSERARYVQQVAVHVETQRLGGDKVQCSLS